MQLPRATGRCSLRPSWPVKSLRLCWSQTATAHDPASRQNQVIHAAAPVMQTFVLLSKTFRANLGPYELQSMLPYQCPYMASIAFWLTRNFDRSSYNTKNICIYVILIHMYIYVYIYLFVDQKPVQGSFHLQGMHESTLGLDLVGVCDEAVKSIGFCLNVSG